METRIQRKLMNIFSKKDNHLNMKAALILFISLLSIYSCKKARGLENKKSKQEFFESIKGEWKVYYYEYRRSYSNINDISSGYSYQEFYQNDTLIRYDGDTSMFTMDLRLNITDFKRQEIVYSVKESKNKFYPISESTYTEANFTYDWKPEDHLPLHLLFKSHRLELRKYGEEIELYYYVNNGEFLISSDITSIKYVFRKI